MKKRISLEKILPEDFESFLTLVGNETVMAMITERPLLREEAQKKFTSMLHNSGLDPLYGSFKVLEAAGSRLAGFAKLEISEKNREEAELGFMLLPEFWGMGLGSEIAGILLDIARSDTHLRRVFAIIDPDNKASRKILVNNGFVSEELGEFDGLPGEILALSV